MNWIKQHLQALHGALGVKRYILGSVVLLAISVYGFLGEILPKYDIHVLPNLPTWEIAIGVILLIVIWWLIQRVVELEKMIEPQLDIQFEDKPPFVITEPIQATEHAQRFCRIKIINKSVKDLSKCLVVLEEIKTPDGEVYPNRFIPVGLTTDHQFLGNRKRGEFNLRGKQYKFIVVACLDETKPNSEITFMYENENLPNGIPRGTYQLNISAYGGGQPTRKKLEVSVDGSGHLRMKAV